MLIKTPWCLADHPGHLCPRSGARVTLSLPKTALSIIDSAQCPHSTPEPAPSAKFGSALSSQFSASAPQPYTSAAHVEHCSSTPPRPIASSAYCSYVDSLSLQPAHRQLGAALRRRVSQLRPSLTRISSAGFSYHRANGPATTPLPPPPPSPDFQVHPFGSA